MFMELYFVNKNMHPNGQHEVHTGLCVFLPSQENRLPLGIFTNCVEAVNEAKKTYSNANGCYYCCRSQDTNK